jgi:hypothetical protein
MNMICGLNATEGWEHTITAMSDAPNKYPIVHGMLRMEHIKDKLRFIVDLHVLTTEPRDESAISIGKQLVLSEFGSLYKPVLFREPGTKKLMLYFPKTKPSDTAFATEAESWL